MSLSSLLLSTLYVYAVMSSLSYLAVRQSSVVPFVQTFECCVTAVSDLHEIVVICAEIHPLIATQYTSNKAKQLQSQRTNVGEEEDEKEEEGQD